MTCPKRTTPIPTIPTFGFHFNSRRRCSYSCSCSCGCSRSNRLFGISEWRDNVFLVQDEEEHNNNDNNHDHDKNNIHESEKEENINNNKDVISSNRQTLSIPRNSSRTTTTATSTTTSTVTSTSKIDSSPFIMIPVNEETTTEDDVMETTATTTTTTTTATTANTKPICLLPFFLEDALLQGQEKELRLYEDHCIKLFHHVMDCHEGIVGMGLMTEDDDDDDDDDDDNEGFDDDDDDHEEEEDEEDYFHGDMDDNDEDDADNNGQDDEAGILSSIPLCEISQYNNMGGTLGIFITLRCIGRAELQTLIQGEPFLMGTCVEITDETTIATTTSTMNTDDTFTMAEEHDNDENHMSSLDLANNLANQIDKTVVHLSVLEEQLSLQLEQQVQEGTLSDMIQVRNDDSDYFYSDNEDDDLPTREERYETAYTMALEADSQGYVMTTNNKAPTYTNTTTSQINNNNNNQNDRTVQELTAISWAVFCTEMSNDLDAPYRLQALECVDLVQRLQLGLSILKEKQLLLESMLSPNSSNDRTPPPSSSSSSSYRVVDDDDDDDDNDDDGFA